MYIYKKNKATIFMHIMSYPNRTLFTVEIVVASTQFQIEEKFSKLTGDMSKQPFENSFFVISRGLWRLRLFILRTFLKL